MNQKPENIRLYAVNLDCPEPVELANFYASLLHWIVPFSDAEYACAAPAGLPQGAYPCLLFQKNEAFVPPVWPEPAGAQQQMAHLDFAVRDLGSAVNHALECGARLAETQFSEGWRVLLDPVGHPFCLCAMRELMDSPDFALR